MQDIIAALEPHFLELIGLVLTILLGLLARWVSAWTGIQIERTHRDALHSAIMTGVRAALRDGPQAGLGTVKEQAIAYAKTSVPDAIRALVPGDTVLDRLAERYAREAMDRYF